MHRQRHWRAGGQCFPRGNRDDPSYAAVSSSGFPAESTVRKSTRPAAWSPRSRESRCSPTRPSFGENAFAHEAGIHQHGVLANRATYEIMTPESVGFATNRMVLGKHSGRHAFEERLTSLGFDAKTLALDELFGRFKVLADKKKTVGDRDIEALVVGSAASVPDTYTLDR